MIVEGAVARLPQELWDDLNTDVILPAAHLRVPEEELGRHAFAGALPDFVARPPGRTVLLGGVNFGCGSSREQAVKALLGAGVELVVAQSFGGIFFRNAFNLGLALFQVPDARRLAEVPDDARVRADLSAGTLEVADDLRIQGTALPAHLQAIVAAGGILPLLRRDPDALTR